MYKKEYCKNCCHKVRFDGYVYKHSNDTNDSYVCLQENCVCITARGKHKDLRKIEIENRHNLGYC